MSNFLQVVSANALKRATALSVRIGGCQGNSYETV